MSKVYLVQRPAPVKASGWTPDLSQAARYGTVVDLLGERDKPAFYPESCFHKLSSRLNAFDQDQDYILWAGGDAVALVMLGVVLEQFKVSHFRWLRFNRSVGPDGHRTGSGEYVPTLIDTAALTKGDDV